MTTKNLKKLLNDNGYTENNEPFDLSIYATNHVLFLPLTTKKFNDDKIHPALTPIDCDIFDCCASYIKEEFEDWDLKFVEVKPEIKKVVKQSTDDTCSEFDEDDNNLYSKIKMLLNDYLKPEVMDLIVGLEYVGLLEILD
jgi:hypothetical protein